MFLFKKRDLLVSISDAIFLTDTIYAIKYTSNTILWIINRYEQSDLFEKIYIKGKNNQICFTANRINK